MMARFFALGDSKLSIACDLAKGILTALVSLLFLSGFICAFGDDASPPVSLANNDRPFRVAFSARVFVGVNENDARASIKVWSQTLGQEQGIPVDPETRILTGIDAIRSAVLREEIDCITVTTDEYWALRKKVPFGPFFMGIKNGQFTEEYLVIVRADSGINSLNDLRGRNISIFESPRASLAPIWLNTLLLKSDLDQAGKFFGKIIWGNKMNKVVLPVFFRQTEACLTTHDGFLTMTELNPQVGKQLKVIARSPPLVPVLFCFRGNYNSINREKLRASIGNIHKTIAGQQTVTLFQTEKLAEYPISTLDNAIELMDEYQHLCAQKKVPMEKPVSEVSK